MPPKAISSLFLGLELATDQLRASIVDENLELVGVEAVDFDTELPEYQTQGGIFTTPGDAYTTPVEMWIKAYDLLMEKLSKSYDLPRIKAIGGAAQANQLPQLQSLDPRMPVHTQISTQSLSLPHAPVAQDTSAHTHGLALEAALGGPDLMAVRVGTCAHASLLAAQLLRVREAWPEVWARTGKVQVASSFLASLACGVLVGMGEAEAAATGLWAHSTTAGTPSHWDEGVMEIVGGNRDEGRRIWGWLGDVDVSGGRRRIGNVSRYLVDRYGFDPEAIVTPFTSDYLSIYLSLCPSPSDAVLSFGPMDSMLAPASNYIPTRLYSLFPHPAQDATERKRYVAMLTSRNADVPRALVRDMYTKSWSAFDRLVAIVPPGGSIGLDDKLFSFWLLQGDSYPFSHVKGIFRFETGVKVNEFRDLRANPRCLLESQILSFRVRWSRMLATGVMGPNAGRGRGANASPSPISGQPKRSASNPSTTMGLPFDPYEYSSLPSRIVATGAAANFPSIANLVGDAFNAPVILPTTQIDAAQVVPHRNAPPPGFPARASLGGAYVARWVWGKEKGTPAGTGRGGFEEEVRRLLAKRWAATGGVPIRTNVNAPSGGNKVTSTPGSGTSTPYGHGARSALGATILVEEEEEEVEEMEKMGGSGMQSSYGMGSIYGDGDAGRMRTMTSSTAGTAMTGSTLDAPSTAFTTPDLSGTNPNPEVITTDTITTSSPASLIPVTAMPTSDAELQLGLAKVAEPDVDAFMSYAAIVPEYCRLESLLVKSIV
ncbi:actin-like ATPase domain-containing protein [Laetiporus sulphureus 93-53]|uniref:Actin-like ATPase domain-containing protein n=1 Tax=Laetiporus sulphureus 93-53 TaxID=1314785 RepID=A0A165C0R1_9APHY|nr:actin-like ATPase domain-containing protein [Laetiporus sulphureus 93-53]KZT01992.1 actin-like ATPase domain-containing protein [Laetiporus sulphureus 93-53]